MEILMLLILESRKEGFLASALIGKEIKSCANIIFSVIYNKLETRESITPSYRNSPFYNLDAFVIPGCDINSSDDPANDQVDIPETSYEIPQSEIPMMKFPKVATASSSCQEIKSLTFITYDSEALDALEEK